MDKEMEKWIEKIKSNKELEELIIGFGKRELEKLVTDSDGVIKVNWSEVIKLEKKDFNLYTKFLEYLESRGVLTNLSNENTWILLGRCGDILNPYGFITPTFGRYGFVNKGDAEEYAKEKYGEEKNRLVGLAKIVKEKVHL